MTGTISEDALQAQQSRIMNAMKAAAAPSQQELSPQDITQVGLEGLKPGGDYFVSLKAAQTAQAQNNLAAQTGIYGQMKEQVARGNTDAAAIDQAITNVAGDDPKTYAAIAEQLHADPDTITPANVKGKVMKTASEMGINPLSNQLVQAKAKTTQMEMIGNYIGNTTDQNSYDKSKAALDKIGVDTTFLPDKFDPTYVNKMRLVGATPTAQLSAVMQQQQMALRGKIAGLDTSALPTTSSPSAAPSPSNSSAIQPVSNAPVVTNQATSPNEVLNNTPGQTPAEKAAALINNYSNPEDNAIPPQPVKRPDETTKNYQSRLQAWKADPAIVAHLSEQGAAGKDTIKYNDTIATEAKQAINMHLLVSEMQDAQKQFQAGALAPAQGTLIRYARALGVPVSSKDVATLSNQQIFTKLQNDIIGQAAKAEGGASRLQAAFNAIKASNPNVGMEPESLNQLFNIMDTKAAEITNEQQAWNEAKKSNPRLSGADFQRGYIASEAAKQEKAGGKLPGYRGNTTSQNNINRVVKFSDLPPQG